MSDTTRTESPFTPREKRDSENVGFGDYAGKIAKSIVITKAAAVAGALVGDRIAGPMGAATGYTMAGIGTAAYEGHQHWKPIKGTQDRLEAILPEVLKELSPDSMKEELALQQQVQDGLAERQRLFTDLVGKAQRQVEPRGRATEALAKESQISETKGPAR